MSAETDYLSRPLSQRRREAPLRDVRCRACARWTVKVDGAWRHLHDDSPACVDPDALWARSSAPAPAAAETPADSSATTQEK